LLSKKALTSSQFSMLFLGIARQVEPHYLDVLFPLCWPYVDNTGFIKDFSLHKSVEDLCFDAAEFGSLSVAASALPLFGKRQEAHRACIEMIQHCLNVIGEKSINIITEQQCSEEIIILSDLFSYGLKLEDEYISCSSHISKERNGSDPRSTTSTQSDEVLEDSEHGDSISESSSSDEDTEEGNLIENSCDTSLASSTSSLQTSCNVKLMHQIARFLPGNKNSLSSSELDQAVSEAASTFIMSVNDEVTRIAEHDGLDKGSFSLASRKSLHEEDSSLESRGTTQYMTVSDAFSQVTVEKVVANFLVSKILSTSFLCCSSVCGWKQASIIANLIANTTFKSENYGVSGPDPLSLTRIKSALSNDQAIAVALELDERLAKTNIDQLTDDAIRRLSCHISECFDQIDTRHCEILECLIHRFFCSKHFEELAELASELALIGLMATYVSNNTESVFVKQSQGTTIYGWFTNASKLH